LEGRDRIITLTAMGPTMNTVTVSGTFIKIGLNAVRGPEVVHPLGRVCSGITR